VVVEAARAVGAAGVAGAAGAEAAAAAAAQLAQVSLVVGREGREVLFCFLAGDRAIVVVVVDVAVVLLECSCISKVLSTLSGFVYIFADMSNVCRLFTSVYQTQCDFSDVEAVAKEWCTDHVIPTL
jgi:hypothetical protein